MAHSVMTEMTKRVLSGSFKKLLYTKPMNKITVKDVVNDCKLSRQTFYYHFQDIYDLLDWTYKNELKELLMNSKCNDWEKTIINLLHYIQKSKTLLPSTIEAVGYEHFECLIYPDLYQFSKDIINEMVGNKVVEIEYKNFLANLHTISLTGLILQWAKKGMKENPDEFVKLLHLTVYRATLNVLEKYGNAC